MGVIFFSVNAGEFLSLVLSDKTKMLKGFFLFEICFSSLFHFFSGSFNVSVLISSMQRVFVVLNYYNYFNYACFCFLCVVCVCLCFVWFVLIHSIITRMKSKATKVERLW